MLAELFTGQNLVYWAVAGVVALGIVGIKLVQMNFERKHKDKK